LDAVQHRASCIDYLMSNELTKYSSIVRIWKEEIAVYSNIRLKRPRKLTIKLKIISPRNANCYFSNKKWRYWTNLSGVNY
jgi:glutaredoxin 2